MPSDSERDALPFEPKKRSRAKSGSKPQQKTDRQDRKRQAEPATPPAATEVSEAARAKAEKIGLKPKRSQKSALKEQAKSQKRNKSRASRDAQPDAIPEVVSQRMIRRMLVFSGVPTGLAAVIFIGSYVVLVRHIFEVPTTLVLLSTLGCFGLGVLGLSYGVLSASWEEAEPGSPLGWPEFRVNFGRMVSAWRKPKQEE